MMKVKQLELDFIIPYYLEKDIKALCKAINSDALSDCEQDEVYGSINLAMTSGEISSTQADILRSYYLYGGILDAG